jgi:small subunit ribosomal protein S16
VAVRIRLKRVGRRHRAFFRLGAFHARNQRDGRAIEELGHYDPNAQDPDKQVVLKRDRIEHWLRCGALPTETVKQLLAKHGIDPKGTNKPPEAAEASA